MEEMGQLDELLKHESNFVEFTRVVDTFIRNHDKGRINESEL